MLAIERRSLKILNLLLRNNSDPNIQNLSSGFFLINAGNAPLHQVLEES